MKTVFPYAAAAAALLIMNACNKNDRPPLPIEEGRIRVEIGIEGTGATRATGIVTGSEASEAKVNDLQIFVFNGDQLDGYAHGTSTKSLSVSCTAGSRDIYAIVNAPSAPVKKKKTAKRKENPSAVSPERTEKQSGNALDPVCLSYQRCRRRQLRMQSGLRGPNLVQPERVSACQLSGLFQPRCRRRARIPGADL